MKKLLAAAMAALMTLGLTACGGGDPAATVNAPDATTAAPGAATQDPASAAATAPADEGYADYSAGFPQKVTIEIPVYDRAFEGWDVTNNYYTQWAQSEFGDKYNVEVKYVAVGRSTEVQDYTQMLTSHTAPTIIMHYDMPQAVTYYTQDVMQELDNAEIANYAPTFWSYSQESTETYGAIDGKTMFTFAVRPAADNYTTIIRKDWVEAAGYKVEDLTTLEKYNEMLLKWKELGLGVDGEMLTQNNYVYSYSFRDWPNDPQWRALYSDLGVADLTTDATKDWLKNLNYMYNNGLVDPEFYLRDDYTKAEAEFVAGNVGTYQFYIAAGTDVFSATLANDPGATFAIVPPGAIVPEGKVAQSRGYWPFGMIMGINYEATDEERIATWMFLEWLSQPDVIWKWQNGVENENYTLNSDGIPVKVADYAGQYKLSNNNNKDYWCLVTEGLRYPTDELFDKANLLGWAPPGYEQLAADTLKYYKEIDEYRTPDALFPVVIASLTEYKTELNELFKQLYVKVATIPEADFESAYADACQEYLDAGYQEILDEKQSLIDSGSFTP
ncbi:MAG: ABC transporter substrate-binding protein [Clostridiales bacterium]|jgi:ABC-type glycerol-3-phosphate transport system substrate-binding protein|nr:ABC transporter substrate-binding protein [Clostridiales bacterium]